MSKVCDKKNAVKVEIVYTELTQEQEQAMFNFFKSRSFPRIIKKLEEEEQKNVNSSINHTESWDCYEYSALCVSEGLGKEKCRYRFG
ncbi:hypothetical protein FOK23_10895 [Listeria monocytogenes]|nr:hypothetical protein [Listeria monocytogenes]